MKVRGRYAPSPTGALHVGNARTALAAWLSARRQEGTVVWRIEDLDHPRVVPGMARASWAELHWLGLDWDEGPDEGGLYGPYRQSERLEHYETAILHLVEKGLLFPCTLSRKDLLELASAPHGPADEAAAYPASLRPTHLPADWYRDLTRGNGAEASVRFKADSEPVVFRDLVFGEYAERVDRTVGDFVLKRRDGIYAYQLAVIVDDILMDITEVVRGADLLTSTARQIQLFRALGRTPPAYAHVPLVLNSAGEKLSKRDGGLTIDALRREGVSAESLTGYLAYTLGLLDRPVAARPSDLVSVFSWSKVRREDWRLPPDLSAELARVM